MDEMTTDAPNTEASTLPLDGTIIRVSQWRRQIAWIPAAVYAFFAVCIAAYAIQKGVPAAALGGLGFGFAAVLSARAALSGVILESRGVKARGTWRTYHWRWEEIERFELRARGEMPRFRVHLRNGKTLGFRGFFARSPEQEARGQALFRALEARLEAERQVPQGDRGI